MEDDMSRGPGRIERAIFERIWKAATGGSLGEPMPVRVRPWDVLLDLYRPADDYAHRWNPNQATPAQRKAVVRAMHSFVRKHPGYALTGGKGRKELILYEISDPESVMWARLTVERRGFVSLVDVRAALKDSDAPVR
jgi:hypothetical protein